MAIDKSRMIRAVVPAQIEQLGEREVRVTISTSNMGRDGHVFDPEGASLTNYRANPIVLWQHNEEHPIGNGEDIVIDGDRITSRAVFAPAGIDPTADRICGLVKAGVIRAVSVGIDPIEAEPLDPMRPKGGKLVRKWELLEYSFCSIPVDAAALVTERSVGASNDNAQETNVTTSTNPPAGNAGGSTNRTTRAIVARQRRTLESAPGKAVLKRGLYDVAQLAYALSNLGYVHSCAEWEAEVEEDGSQVPAMLGEALQKLGEALCAMTDEEVKEFMAEHGGEAEADEGDGEERAYIAGAKTALQRAWRRGLAMARAGRKISADTKESLETTDKHLSRAFKHHRVMAGNHEEIANCIGAMRSVHEEMRALHEDLGAATGEAGDQTDGGGDAGKDGNAAIKKAHKALGKHLDKQAGHLDDAEDAHGDVVDAHSSAERAMKRAATSIRALVDGSSEAADDEDGNSQNVQTSAGTGVSKGSSNNRSMTADFRRRQADLLALSANN